MGKLKASKHIMIDDAFIEQIKERLSKDVVIASENYSVREASIYLNTTEATLRKHIREAKIPAFKIGGKSYYITGTEIEKFLNKNKA